ncbi:MAG: hypothetical protein Q9187_000617 [Circinaria calcarea]
MTILLTGGTGKTSMRIARLLKDADTPVLLASRSNSAPPPYKSCRFDWLDNTTHPNPFVEAEITAVYLVAPSGVLDILPVMKAFIDFAKSKGVQRFVLLSASDIPAGGHFTGKVHEYLISLGVEYAVLRPTWFMENFSEGQHLGPIRQHSRFYSASGEGKAPFVSAEDIAAVAFHALVDKPPHNTDHVILGPELLSYDDVADILSKVLHRKITHVKITESEKAAAMHSNGMPEDYAKMLASLDTKLSNGVEARMNNVVKEVTGGEPKAFSAFAKENKSCWE